MPPRNPARSLLTEEALAERVAIERDRRGWTFEGLARRMTDVGCAINQSALYKIEKGEPRRRITVDELVALSRVFSIPVDQLLLPVDLAASERAGELLMAWDRAREASEEASEQASAAWLELVEHVRENPTVSGPLEDLLRSWAEARWGTDYKHLDEAAAYWLSKVTDKEDDRERWLEMAKRELASRG